VKELRALHHKTVSSLATAHPPKNRTKEDRPNPFLIMWKDKTHAKAYDSVEYGILLPDKLVVPVKNKKKTMSWPKCLCITLIVMLILFLVTAAIVSLSGYLWMKHQVRRVTTDEPLTFPIHELPEAELEVVKDRAKLFYDSVQAGIPTEDLVLTEDEFNGFIAHSDYLRGNAIIHITENKVMADMSLPARFLPGGKGRYLVASGFVSTEPEAEDGKTLITTSLKTHYDIEGLKYPTLLYGEDLAFTSPDGTKMVTVKSGQFYNWVIPRKFIDKQENLLDHICDDDDDKNDEDCQQVMTFLNGLDSVSIVDQQIIFRAATHIENRRLSKESKESSYHRHSWTRRVLKKIFVE
jgi:hypothetical protein